MTDPLTRRLHELGMFDAYPKDVELMGRLGLTTSGWTPYEWQTIGTVEVTPERPRTDTDCYKPAATVKVEVCTMPAHFWQFTIHRPKDDIVEHPPEVFTVSTGSGAFSDFWPTAELIATNGMTVVEGEAKRG